MVAARDLWGNGYAEKQFMGERVVALRYLRPDGTTMWGLIGIATSERDANGRPLRGVAIVQDVTAQLNGKPVLAAQWGPSVAKNPFLQFTVILDFMVLSPLGAMLMPSLGITPKQFGLVVSAYALSAGAADSLINQAFALRGVQVVMGGMNLPHNLNQGALTVRFRESLLKERGRRGWV